MFFFNKNKNKNLALESGKNDLIITNYLTDGLLVFDDKNKIVLANPQAERLFEIKEENILGKSILELSRFENLRPLISLLGGGIKPVVKQEVEIKENLILEVTSVPIVRQGERTNVLIIVHNITREKMADKMKSEFVTLAAHQLRTPTSGIKWSLETLLEGDYGELNSVQKEAVQKAYNTNDKVIELVRDLLDVAQIEEGKYLNNLALSNIAEIIQSVLDSRSQEIVNRKLIVEFQKEEVPRIMLDAEKTDIAIKNILDNAIRYTKPGGEIIINLKRNKKEIEIQIKDSGVGIPEEEQSRVFSKFFRGSNITKMETEGTGLGLYIAKNIIEAHGGKVWFESRRDEGTIFYIIIPIKERFGEFLTSEFY